HFEYKINDNVFALSYGHPSAKHIDPSFYPPSAYSYVFMYVSGLYIYEMSAIMEKIKKNMKLSMVMLRNEFFIDNSDVRTDGPTVRREFETPQMKELWKKFEESQTSRAFNFDRDYLTITFGYKDFDFITDTQTKYVEKEKVLEEKKRELNKIMRYIKNEDKN